MKKVVRTIPHRPPNKNPSVDWAKRVGAFRSPADTLQFQSWPGNLYRIFTARLSIRGYGLVVQVIGGLFSSFHG
jgi:hypothetical protein